MWVGGWRLQRITCCCAATAAAGGSAELYVKSGCGFSKVALLARKNLHLTEVVTVRNITDDADAKDTLEKVAGKTQVPCLVTGGEAKHESAEIVDYLTGLAAPLPA